MINVSLQYITDNKGKKLSVVLPIKAFQSIMEELQDLADSRLYDAAKKGKQGFIDMQQAFKEIEKLRKTIMY